MPRIELVQKFSLAQDSNTKLKNLQLFAKNRTYKNYLTSNTKLKNLQHPAKNRTHKHHLANSRT